MGEYLDANLLKNRFTINLCSQAGKFLGKPQTNFDATDWAAGVANGFGAVSGNPASWGAASTYPQGPNVEGLALNNVVEWDLENAGGFMTPPEGCKGVVVGLKSIQLGTAAGPTLVGSNYSSLSPIAPYHTVNVQLQYSGERNGISKIQGADVAFQSGVAASQPQQGDTGDLEVVPRPRMGQGILATLMTKPYDIDGYVAQTYGPNPTTNVPVGVDPGGSPYTTPWRNGAFGAGANSTGGGKTNRDDGMGALISGVLDYSAKGDPCARGIFCGADRLKKIRIALLDYNGREIKMGNTLQLMNGANLSAFGANPATVPAWNQPWSISLVFQYIV